MSPSASPLPASPPPDAVTAVVRRLRAAGCVFAEDEARLLAEAAATVTQLEEMVDRRVAGLPLEHLLGWAEFCGLRVEVDPGVFVPRRRTEFLVDTATGLVAGSTVGSPGRPGAVVVDLCCGSGAVGAAIAARVPGIELHAADVDPAAVRCARRNLAPTGGRVHQGDLYAALPASLLGRVDVLVANAPYVPTPAIGLMPPEARLHEARVALDGGRDGLDVLRRVAAPAPRWLAAGGHLVVETSERQASHTAAIVERAGLVARVVGCDERAATIVTGSRVTGSRPPAAPPLGPPGQTAAR